MTVHPKVTVPFKPMDWDKVPDWSGMPTVNGTAFNGTVVTGNLTTSGTITGTISQRMPGALIDYQMKYDLDLVEKMHEAKLNLELKRDMAVKLAEKMMEDGHIVFTKQAFPHENEMRYRAYTWVGDKNFIEQQRKSK